MLTQEEKQLKEAIKLLIRDGREGRLFEKAKERYKKLISAERIENLSKELDGVTWAKNYNDDIEIINKLIGKQS